MVFAFHALLIYQPHFGSPATRPAAMTALLNLGQAGVPLFFVLSAFLVTSILIREREESGRIDVKAFLIRRALRLLPLYYAVLLFVAPYMVPRTPAYPAYLTLNADIYHAIHGGMAQGGTLVVLWSIGVEEKFYLAWAFGLAALVALRPDRDRVARAAIAMIAAGWIFRLAVAPFLPTAAIEYGPLGYLDCFGWGILIALGRWRIPALPSAIALPFFLIGLWCSSLIELTPGLPGLAAVALGKGLIAIVSGVFLFSMKNATRGWATIPWLRWIGTVSYGSYLFHNLLLAFEARLPIAPFSPLGIFARIVTLGVTLLLAGLSFRYFERPFLKLKSRFAAGASRAA